MQRYLITLIVLFKINTCAFSIIGWLLTAFSTLVKNTFSFAIVLTIAALAAVTFANLKLARRIRESTEIARRISQGASFADNDGENQNDLVNALHDVYEYIREKTVIADQIATGNLAGNVVLRSDADDVETMF